MERVVMKVPICSDLLKIVGETKFLFFHDQNCAEKEVEINMMFLQRLLFIHGIDIFNDDWK